ILAKIGLQAGQTFVDVGCGGGFFALPAARIIGKKGRLHGFDENAEAITSLKDLAAKEGLDNLELAIGNAEETILCDGCAHIVFFGLVVVHLAEPVKALENARKMLRSEGRLAVFDWKRKLTRQGPPLEQRLSEGQIVDFIKAAGFGGISVEDCGPYHYVITARL
ncbi:MAG: methyltransferase domain-containing protein, partial [Chloroflexota bacterium]